jgi:serine/threonine protein phosphatase 1
MKKYAISDIHGCVNTFIETLSKIGLNKDDNLYLLGDYIDRGVGSIKIIDKIISLRQDGFNINCLTGNHEQMLLDAYKDASREYLWVVNGGSSVLKELNINSVKDIPKIYIDFLENLKYYIESDNFLFVHAGVNTHVSDPLADKESLIWIRKWYDRDGLEDWLQGRKIVHGHTPITKNEIEKTFKHFEYGSFLNIDNGCVFSGSTSEGYGNLCCVNLTDNEILFQQNID